MYIRDFEKAGFVGRECWIYARHLCDLMKCNVVDVEGMGESRRDSVDPYLITWFRAPLQLGDCDSRRPWVVRLCQ